LLKEEEIKGEFESSGNGIPRAWYDEKSLKTWNEHRALTLKTTDPQLKQKLVERDLILYPDAEEYCQCSWAGVVAGVAGLRGARVGFRVGGITSVCG
jgi:hypothetical protein